MDALKRSLGISKQQEQNGPHQQQRVRGGRDEREGVTESSTRPRPSMMTMVQTNPRLHSQRQFHQRSPPGEDDDDDFVVPAAAAVAAPTPRADVINLTDSNDVKNRLMSVWHSMKYGKAVWALDSGINLAGNSSVILLGQCYHKKLLAGDGGSRLNGLVMRPREPDFEVDAAISAFTQDFCSRLWFTYRREFEEFHGTSLTTDCGWGCMIRSGQMLLGNTLMLQHFGRKWRWRGGAMIMSAKDVELESRHRSIIRLFGDTRQSDLSIHNLLNIATSTLGRHPGDWFGPASTAHLLREAVERSRHEMLENLRVYVANDCTVYRQDVRDLCRRAKRRKKSTPTAAAVPSEGDFSIVDHPDEYPTGLLVTDTPASSGKGRLYGGLVDGVPYFEEASEVVESKLSQAELEGDFQELSDGTEFYSLNKVVKVDGEEWLMEAAAASSSSSAENGGGGSSSHGRARQQQQIRNGHSAEATPEWSPVLILIPIRLGMERLNPQYIPCLTSLLATENCVGIIGGRPRHSLYFVGFQEESLIHLDPHLVQDNVNVFRHNFSVDSFHCRSPRKMDVRKMDPSCCVGFFCESERSFEGWCEVTRQLVVPPGLGPDYPMFGIVEGRSSSAAGGAGRTSPSLLILAEEAAAAAAARNSGEELVLSEDFVFL